VSDLIVFCLHSVHSLYCVTVEVKIFQLTVHGCCKETFQSIAMNICTVHCRMLRNLVHVKNQQLQECIYSTLYNKVVVQTV